MNSKLLELVKDNQARFDNAKDETDRLINEVFNAYCRIDLGASDFTLEDYANTVKDISSQLKEQATIMERAYKLDRKLFKQAERGV